MNAFISSKSRAGPGHPANVEHLEAGGAVVAGEAGLVAPGLQLVLAWLGVAEPVAVDGLELGGGHEDAVEVDGHGVVLAGAQLQRPPRHWALRELHQHTPHCLTLVTWHTAHVASTSSRGTWLSIYHSAATSSLSLICHVPQCGHVSLLKMMMPELCNYARCAAAPRAARVLYFL